MCLRLTVNQWHGKKKYVLCWYKNNVLLWPTFYTNTSCSALHIKMRHNRQQEELFGRANWSTCMTHLYITISCCKWKQVSWIKKQRRPLGYFLCTLFYLCAVHYSQSRSGVTKRYNVSVYFMKWIYLYQLSFAPLLLFLLRITIKINQCYSKKSQCPE